MMVMDLPWNKVSSPIQELNFFFPLVLKVIEPKDQDKEKENLLEDALLVLILNHYQSPLSKKENNKSQALPTSPSQED